MDLIKDLEYRGLLNQVTDEEGLRKALNKPVKFYCGFDPTGDSLHVGHLLIITTMMRFQKEGHLPIALVGGGTGLIGDPSGRSSERSLNTHEVVEGYVKTIHDQLFRFLDFNTSVNPAIMANNFEWLGQLSLIEFLRDVGKHFPLNFMLSKESVSSRLENGISFTEFSYMMLQSFDYLNLYEKENCRLQIGGSDQWGNITAGLELIRRNGHEEQAFGLTFPLITKSDGTKFGKSSGGAIWLDAEKTTPYEFYQFWFNTNDLDVIRFIKYFTFLTPEEVDSLEKSVKESPEKRLAQKTLAEVLTKMVHGEAALEQAINISDALFSGEIKQLTGEEIKQGFKDVPSYTLDSREEKGLIDLLVESSLSPSKRQAREDIQNGAIYINGERQTELHYQVGASDRIEDEFIIIRRGKKKYMMIKFS